MRFSIIDPVRLESEVSQRQKRAGLLGNANNEPSQDSVTKIQKAVPSNRD